MGDMGMNSPIIIFNPSGLTEDQVKQVKDALDAAYRAGYETAKEFYQLKFNTETTKNPQPLTWITGPGRSYGVEMNNCSHDNCVCGATSAITNVATGYVVKNDITGKDERYCDHSYVNAENKAKGICGKCGISFDAWHG